MSDNITEEQMCRLIEYLKGTTSMLETAVEDILGIEGGELSLHDYHLIDDSIFNCCQCGWWNPQDENAADDDEEWICDQCKGENDDK